MADDHYLPFFVGDFMASTATWTGPERGLYMQMLAIEWASGPLPCDPQRLARVLGYEWSEFEPLWPTVKAKFENGNGRLTNAKLETHRAKNTELRLKRHEIAQQGAAAMHANRIAKSMLQASTEHSSEHALSTASSNALSMLSTPIRSTPNLSRSKKKSSARQIAPSWFAEFKFAYPPRAGSQEWAEALRRANARIAEGHTPQEFIDGAKRYAAYNRAIGKLRTEYVQQAKRFLGPSKFFLEAWEQPPTKAQTRQDENVEAAKAWLEGSDETA